MTVMRRSRWLARRRSSRFEQADVQVVPTVGLGQRAGDGDGFCIPGIPVSDDQVVVGADLRPLRWLEASGQVIPLDLLRQGNEPDGWPAIGAGEEVLPVVLVDRAAHGDLDSADLVGPVDDAVKLL